MTIFIPEAKQDKLRDGDTVYISKLDHSRCPVKITQRYIEETKLGKNADNFLISRLAKTKKGHNAIGKYSLSYTTIRDNFKEMVGAITQVKLGLHSLRAGGATSASENGVSDRLIGKHGRWSSSTSRDTYISIKDSKRVRLSVSERLGL